MGDMAKSLTGSQDIFRKEGRSPCSSINFITAHDGFTLYDLYSYGDKHNFSNGEENRDGSDSNNSWNCGIEGDTQDSRVLELRKRMVKNALCSLIFARGVPMLLSGDEVLRTQEGNNNAYCHDSPLNWFPWEQVQRECDILKFCRKIIDIRKRFPALHACSFFRGEHTGTRDTADIRWFDGKENTPDWDSPEQKLLCYELYLGQDAGFLFFIFNAGDEDLEIRLPPGRELLWFHLCDTSENRTAAAVSTPIKDMYRASARSVAVLHGKPAR
jgi:glycogen operon protein